MNLLDFLKKTWNFNRKIFRKQRFLYTYNTENILEIKNDFFHWINKINSDANWVDIEMEYYKYLKELLKQEVKNSESKEIDLLLNEESGNMSKIN